MAEMGYGTLSEIKNACFVDRWELGTWSASFTHVNLSCLEYYGRSQNGYLFVHINNADFSTPGYITAIKIIAVSSSMGVAIVYV